MVYKSDPRGARPVNKVAIHTAEGARTAASLGAYFWRPDIQASSHVGIDAGATVQYVPYSRSAWTLRSGNPISDNAELCGFARWTREQWMSTGTVDGITNPRAILDRAADWIRERSAARGVPVRKLVPAEVERNAAGIIGHIDWTLGMHDGTHVDPGPRFPWDYVINRAQRGQQPATTKEDDDMITVPAGEDDHINLFVKDKTQLYVACSWGRHVVIHNLYFYGDTGPDGGGTGVGGAIEGLTIDANRPGPLSIPPGAAMATLRYTADHSFGVGAA
jgi:N-acetylmuramoyl-L-alanine amidase CwlA